MTDKLTRVHSIQEALRIYFQPIKYDDPKLDFYTMYKRETTEYDTQYIEKYNEDLNTTLIFVRFYVLTLLSAVFTVISGWPVLNSQLRIHYLHPAPAPTRFRRPVPSLPPRDPPHPQPIPFPTRRPLRSPNLEWSPLGDHYDFGSSLRKSFDVAIGRFRRDARKTVVDQISPTRWRIGG